MNKTQYRIIFNPSRGCLMAVAETAQAQGKSASGQTHASRSALPAAARAVLAVSPLQLACWVLAGVMGWSLPLMHTAQAQTVSTRIVADPNAPKAQQATILRSGNDVIQVNIQTPSAAGVSRNTYTQFDVGAQGAILNNSRTSVQTQQGGWVQANPWLATGSARVILNEINSTNPSQLQGYVEVAGQRAEVIMANPAGIAVNGGGFINASRVTLTTGTAVMSGGSLDSYRVQGGTVRIDGQGLDTRGADYTAILTRALQVNAGVWANELHVVTGANDIQASSVVPGSIPVPSAISSSSPAPSVALDVAQLGGMYAGKIHLIGTEAGLGVRNAGQIQASSGSLTLSSEGWLQNSGTLRASGGDVSAQTRGTVEQSGTLYSNRNVQLTSQSNQTHNGMVAALGDVKVQATGTNVDGTSAHITGTPATVWAAGLQTDGQLIGQQNLNVYASGQVQLAGKALATQSLTMQGEMLDLRGTSVTRPSVVASTGGSVSLTATSGDVQTGLAQVISAGQLSIVANTHSNQRLDNSQGLLSGQQLLIQVNQINNIQGSVLAAQDLMVQSDEQINNDQGELNAGRNLQINTTKAVPSILHISNAAGQIVADQNVIVQTATLSGAGTIASQGDINLSLQGDHTLAGNLQAGKNLQIHTTGQLTNPISVQAGQNLSLIAQKLDNQTAGELLSRQTTQLEVAETLTNRGLIDGADTRIQAGNMNNLGAGRIYGDRVAIAAITLTNQEETLSGKTTSATIAARERLDLGLQTLINRENALIYSGGDMSVAGALNANWQATGIAQTINNNSATIEAAQNLVVQAANIRNTNQHFASQVQQISQTAITEYQHAPGDVVSAGDNSTRFAPANVSITDCEALCMTTSAGTSDAFVRYDYTRTDSESKVTQSAPGKILAGKEMNLAANAILNDKSQIVAGGNLIVQTTSLDNVQGEGVHITDDAGTVTSYWRRRKSGRDTYSTNASAYDPAPIVQTISLNGARYEQGSANASSTAAPATSALADVNAKANAAINPGQAPLPNSSLYRQRPETSAKYLVETDPKFANYKTWLGSDYMLSALNLDPATSQKRLGDGFYEQKLIREQVMALTGNRYLGDYTSDEQEYMALMNSGLTYAKQFNLRPGIALTPDQIAQLTSDMVWLVSQDVTLADGSKQSVLVPQVYVRVRPGDLDGSGALLAGADVNLNLTGDLTNSGTIKGGVAGRNALKVSADNIRNLGGQMSAGTLALQAKQDIDNIGGTLQAQSAAVLLAGRDINLTTTTQSSSNQAGANSFSNTGIDRVAGLYVKGSAGTLVASAGRDLNLTAAAVGNAGRGDTQISAGKNLNLNTITTSNSQDINWSGVNYLRQSQSQDVGSQIGAAGNLTVSAGKDLNAKAAAVNAGQALNVNAGNNVNITQGQASQSLDTANTVTSKGTLSSRTLSTRETSQSTTALGSSFEGQSVSINAGQDLNVKGSNVLADQSVNLAAGGNVNITAAQNTQTQSNYRQETKSGLMSSGGIGFTVGSRMQSVDQGQTQTTAAGSTIGSTGGNVTINAGGAYTQTGSDVLTPKGDIAIAAKSVDINEARETGSQSTEQKFKQSGLTVAITSPVLSAVQTASNQLQAAGNTGSGRMQALAAANAGFNLKQGADAIKAGQGDANGMVKNADGKLVEGNAADKAGGIGINISIGASSSQSKQQSSADTAKGSNLSAGGNVTITATRTAGAPNDTGKDSDITVRGSTIEAGKATTLKADDQVNIVAAQNTTTESSNSSSKSGSVGVAIQLGAGGGGMGFTASASASKGQGAGNSTTYTNSQVAGNTVNIESGGDTNLKGAVVKGNQVTADVGGNLNIESLQDKSQYNEKSQSAGGSVMVGAGFSGSVNLASTKINSDYLSVGEQSAIRTGDGGFNVNVNGKTTLTGGQITSTQAAIDNNKNSYEAKEGTTTTDLQNSAKYSAQSMSVGIGAGAQPGKSASAGMSGVGFGNDKGSANSTTTAGISGITGNTNARTGDKETGLTQIFDKDKTQKEVAAQVAITSEFGKQASKAVGDYAGSQLKELNNKANAETDPDKKAALQAEAAKWEEGGSARVALHAVVGGLTGGAAGAVGAGAASAAAPNIDQLQGQLKTALKGAGLGDNAANVISSLAGGTTAAAIGAAASGGTTAGGATAFNADMNNRQLHPSEVQKAKELAAKSGGKYTQAQIEEQMRLMGNAATVEQPNTTTVLTNTDAIVNSLNNDPSMPKTAQGNVVMEVPGKANSELQSWIIGNTKEGVGYIPGQSPYINSNAALNGPVLTTTVKVDAPTAKWANGDFNSAAGMPADKTGAAKVPDGSYGVGLYTPVGGGEIEVEVKNNEAVGGKVGIGAGVGGHINLGTKKVNAEQLLGPVGGGKSDPILETNPQNPATVRVGTSITAGAGLGTVGAEASLAAGVDGDGKSTQTFTNASVGNLTVSPVLPKIQGEIKINVLEISVKAPQEPAK